ncbi:MAG: peptide chain release factor N(5)-glutamine methyltransferase [Sedimentisphaerales bacterium]|nr:peptide chain release factor N(5)-glutamine methyltransferase [Sedimentisphaerales bacterium]
MQNWTIQKLLNWITGYFTDKAIDSPRLSAELLLAFVLQMKRIELYTNFDKPVAKEQLNHLHDLVKRAGENEPVAYLTGRAKFYSLELDITPDCMIPRPETELLVEHAIEILRARTGNQFVCDLCTGCGCIAIAIARNYPNADIIATDISDAALSFAVKNVEKHQLKDRIKLLSGDLFEPITPQLEAHQFDLITCNPPYVSEIEFEKLEKNVRDYEPATALLAGADGLDIHRKISQQVCSYLKADGILILEIGYEQGQAVRDLLEQAGCFRQISIKKDIQKHNRVIIAER